MMTRAAAVCCGFGLLLAGASAAAAAAEPPQPEHAWERYKILVARNAFSRTRGETPKAAAAADTAPAPRPERYTVLTGVVQQGDAFVALLEEVRGNLTKVTAGDAIAGGKVTAITLDGIVFEKDGRATNVPIGRSLSLGPSSSSAPEGGAPVAATAPARPPAGTQTAPKDPAASILERLRQRRARELGK